MARLRHLTQFDMTAMNTRFDNNESAISGIISNITTITAALASKASNAALDALSAIVGGHTTSISGLGGRITTIENIFANKSAFVANLEENAGSLGVTLLGISVGTATAQAAQNVAINKLKTCLVSHGLMNAA